MSAPRQLCATIRRGDAPALPTRYHSSTVTMAIISTSARTLHGGGLPQLKPKKNIIAIVPKHRRRRQTSTRLTAPRVFAPVYVGAACEHLRAPFVPLAQPATAELLETVSTTFFFTPTQPTTNQLLTLPRPTLAHPRQLTHYSRAHAAPHAAALVELVHTQTHKFFACAVHTHVHMSIGCTFGRQRAITSRRTAVKAASVCGPVEGRPPGPCAAGRHSREYEQRVTLAGSHAAAAAGASCACACAWLCA